MDKMKISAVLIIGLVAVANVGNAFDLKKGLSLTKDIALGGATMAAQTSPLGMGAGFAAGAIEAATQKKHGSGTEAEPEGHTGQEANNDDDEDEDGDGDGDNDEAEDDNNGHRGHRGRHHRHHHHRHHRSYY